MSRRCANARYARQPAAVWVLITRRLLAETADLLRRAARKAFILCAITVAACSSTPNRPPPSMPEVAQATAATTEPGAPPPIPPEAAQRFDNAITLLSAGDLPRAEAEFKRLAEMYPEYSGALTNLGILYLKSDKLAEAEQSLRAAIERSPTNAVAFNQLGIVYRRLGRFKDADAAYSRALTIDPNYALAHLNLGVLCDLYLQQPERALAAFERYVALTSTPDTRVASWMKELQGRVKTQTGHSQPGKSSGEGAVQ